MSRPAHTLALRLLAGGLLLLPAPALLASGDATATKRQIETVRGEIESLNKSIKADQGKKASEQKAVAQLDREIASISSDVRKLQAQISTAHEHLKALEQQQRDTEKKLAGQRAAIEALVQSAHRNGQEEPVKLLLNQQDPATLNRLMKYQRYSHQARQEKLEAFDVTLYELQGIKDDARAEIARLAELKTGLDNKQAQIADKKKQRAQAIAQLDKKISQQGGQLKTLEANKANLEAVLKRIQEAIARQKVVYHNPTPVLKQRGNLPWPVSGAIIRSFGSTREGELRYQGVLLEAGEGTPVKAVHNGQVVFSDWLRGYGMLTIIDHGNGFLSLYGNNQSLTRKPGDRVAAGDVLAYSGNSGQNLPGVYFEIRKGSTPVNPQEWCSRR